MASAPKPAPADIAREVFRRLARMRRPPTPENYARVFAETAGLSYAQVQPAAAAMETLARGVLADASAGEFARELRQAIEGGRWPQAQRLIRAALKRTLTTDGGEQGASVMVGAAFPATEDPASVPQAGAQPAAPARAGDPLAAAREDALARLVAPLLDARLGFTPEAAAELGAALEALRAAASPAALSAAGERLRTRWAEIELAGEGPAPAIRGLHELVRLMVRNMGDLVVDDAWVHEQTRHIQSLLDRPLSPAVLEQTARGYREFVFRQGTVKHSMDEAATSVRERTAALIDQVGGLADWTGDFAGRIGDYARQVREADDLSRMSGLLQALLAEMQAMQERFAQAHRELIDAGERVARDERRVQAMQEALGAPGGLPDEDPASGALSQPGFERQVEFELARAQRRTLPICVALLDASAVLALPERPRAEGGEPQRRLATALREALRSTDTPASWDENGFAIVLPDTGPEEAARQLVRVQRELTKRYFLEDPGRGLVTFSAGVAARRDGEPRAALMARAEAALARARESGRNRVWIDEASQAHEPAAPDATG
jgi:diguanylate cyclase